MAEQPQITSEQPSSSPSPSLHIPSDPSPVPVLSGALANCDFQIFPIMYPALINAHQNQEHGNRGAGLYAVPVYPYSGPVVGFPTNNLIPLTYNIPTRTSTEASATGEEHSQEGQQQQRPNQQAGPQQRQVIVVRRFQIAFQLDILLILKLAAMIFLFNQDGSRQKLAVLVFFASLVYFYQTGALTPLVRWLSQGMHRAAVPPHQPRPAVRPENVGPPVRPGVRDDALPGDEHGRAENENENENQAGNNGDEVVEDENMAEPERGNQWWGIVKEIQMIVFGFITSLLPGFHNID